MKKIKLGDLCKPSQGQIKEQPDTVIDYIDISSVDNESKTVTGYQTMTFEESPSRARKAVKKGSILVSTVRPNLNAVALLEEDTPNLSVASTGFCILDCKDNVDNRFVFNFCKSKPFIDDMVSQATGASYPAVSDKIIRSALIPAYSYDEQRKIGEILDRVSSVVESRKHELDVLDNLIKARFVEMSSEWNCQEKPLGDYLDEITYGFTNPMPDAEEGPWKITAKDVVDGHINFETARKTAKKSFDALTSKSKPVIGDVLLTKDGTLGRTAIVEEEGICVNQSVAVLRCNNQVVPRFLSLLLQLPEYQREMTKNSGGGTIKHIYITKVDKMFVRIPAIDKQESFIKFVEQVDKSKAIVQQALNETQQLFDKLMQEYFG
ncbi:MAG TPA: restriction endonuclease subunit S [Saccharofermentans sp.]|nr:restriction endonuclease subunit S [Saccharofermentans sp.]